MWIRFLLLFCFVFGTSVSCFGASVNWNASIVDAEHGAPDGYRVYYGSASDQLTTTYDVGAELNFPIPETWNPATYYFGVRAYNAYGESGWATTPEGQTWVSYVKADPPPVLPPEPATDVQIVWEPIVATFGFSSTETTYRGADANYILLAGPFSPSSNGTLTSISFRLRIDTAVSFTFGIYSDSGGYPDQLIAQSAGTTLGTGTDWYTLDVSASISSGTNYWFAFNHATGDTSRFFYTSGTRNCCAVSQTYSAGNLTSDLSVSSYLDDGNRDYHAYGTYTESGGASAVPKIMLLQDHFSGGIH